VSSASGPALVTDRVSGLERKHFLSDWISSCDSFDKNGAAPLCPNVSIGEQANVGGERYGKRGALAIGGPDSGAPWITGANRSKP
jgi:hypothetical protein